MRGSTLARLGIYIAYAIALPVFVLTDESHHGWLLGVYVAWVAGLCFGGWCVARDAP